MSATTTRGLQDSVTNVYNDARESVEHLKEDVQDVGRQATHQVERGMTRARRAADRAAKSAVNAAKENPVLATGVLLGAGVVIGMVLQRVLMPPPTPREVMFNALKRRGLQTSAAVVAGYQLARRALR